MPPLAPNAGDATACDLVSCNINAEFSVVMVISVTKIVKKSLSLPKLDGKTRRVFSLGHDDVITNESYSYSALEM